MTPQELASIASSLDNLGPLTIVAIIVIVGLWAYPRILDARGRVKAQEAEIEKLKLDQETLRLEQLKNLAISVEKSLEMLSGILKRDDDTKVENRKLQSDFNNLMIQSESLRKRLADCQDQVIDERVKNELIARQEAANEGKSKKTRASRVTATPPDPSPSKL